MGNKHKNPVPYNMVTPGFEAVYTGKASSSNDEKVELITTITTDEEGNEIRKWPVIPWTFPGQEKEWDKEIHCINSMQKALGELDENTRRIRAHIASLVPCDSGFPVTVDELLNAIGKGELDTPSFHNGCWCPGMWWRQKTTQPQHMKSMKIIHTIIMDYLSGNSRENAIIKFPGALKFINRTYDWLGPISELQEYQKLMIQRMLLTVDFFTKTDYTIPLFLDSSKLKRDEKRAKELFGEDGLGSRLDMNISEKAGLPKIYPRWEQEYLKTLEHLTDPKKKELYITCCALCSGVYTLSDCHHNTFRYIEGWIHGIGTGRLQIPARKAGTEKNRLKQLLFGYVLGLDKWLVGIPLQFLLLDLGHIDFGFDPKNEILRVYAYLGEQQTPVKKWLAACLWHNLMNCSIGGYPGGLIRHKDLLERAAEAGIMLREWMDSVLSKQNNNQEI